MPCNILTMLNIDPAGLTFHAFCRSAVTLAYHNAVEEIKNKAQGSVMQCYII